MIETREVDSTINLILGGTMKDLTQVVPVGKDEFICIRMQEFKNDWYVDIRKFVNREIASEITESYPTEEGINVRKRDFLEFCSAINKVGKEFLEDEFRYEELRYGPFEKEGE